MPEAAPRVALVHDWLVGQRGGEQVLLALARRFPTAPIYTLVHVPGSVHPEIEAHPIVTSGIADLPGSPAQFRRYLPLFGAAVAAWDFSGYEGIVSTSHCVAMGARRRPDQWHLAYIHTPMRYLYDQMHHYLPAPPWGPWLYPWARLATAGLRRGDRQRAQGPSQLVANSAHVAGRIRRVWGRTAVVVHPPVDVDYFAAAPVVPVRRGLLVVGALVPYKRVDRAIALANAQRLPLTVVGRGPELARLRRLAGPSVQFAPELDRAGVRAAYAGARGLLFPCTEDFGLVPVEAMAAGCPVLALAAGGALETVGQGAAAGGVTFAAPTLPAMAAAVAELEQGWARGAFAQESLLARARQFDAATFDRRMDALLPCGRDAAAASAGESSC